MTQKFTHKQTGATVEAFQYNRDPHPPWFTKRVEQKRIVTTKAFCTFALKGSTVGELKVCEAGEWLIHFPEGDIAHCKESDFPKLFSPMGWAGVPPEAEAAMLSHQVHLLEQKCKDLSNDAMKRNDKYNEICDAYYRLRELLGAFSDNLPEGATVYSLTEGKVRELIAERDALKKENEKQLDATHERSQEANVYLGKLLAAGIHDLTLEQIQALSAQPQLRLIASGMPPVPEGCVRKFAHNHKVDGWVTSTYPFPQYTHYVDIRLPTADASPEPAYPRV